MLVDPAILFVFCVVLFTLGLAVGVMLAGRGDTGPRDADAALLSAMGRIASAAERIAPPPVKATRTRVKPAPARMEAR